MILRGQFRAGAVANEWCDRRLLARIHRMTLGRLRREIEPAEPAAFTRFLLRWQHVAPGTQVHGLQGLSRALEQLAGVEAPVAAWERDILPARVAGYSPALLDELCLSGEIVWGRRSRSEASLTTRATPISLWPREATPWLLAERAPTVPEAPVPDGGEGDDAPTKVVVDLLTARGALFYAEILEATGLMRRQLDEALWTLVARGRLTADGFSALRTLAAESPRRTGRWSLLGATAAAPPPPERARRPSRPPAPGALRRRLSRARPQGRSPCPGARSSCTCAASKLAARSAADASSPAWWASNSPPPRPWMPCAPCVASRPTPPTRCLDGGRAELLRVAEDPLLARLNLPGLPAAIIPSCPFDAVTTPS